MTDQKPADVTGTAPKDNKSGQDVTEKPAAGPREPKRLWAYRGKISEKEGIRTAISWDGPPSPAYTCFVPESYADELKRELEYAKTREKRDMQDRIDQAKELMAERDQLVEQAKTFDVIGRDEAYAEVDRLRAVCDQLRKERDEFLFAIKEVQSVLGEWTGGSGTVGDVFRKAFNINAQALSKTGTGGPHKLAEDRDKWREQAAKFYSTIRNLFCDPEGNPSFMGSAGDKKILRDLLSEHAKAVEGK